MLRRRFHSSGIHPSNASNGVYGVAENLKLLPPNKVDAECIGVALIHKEHRIINDILYLIGGKMLQASTEAYMTSSECNDRNYWAVSCYGQVGVSDKRNIGICQRK